MRRRREGGVENGGRGKGEGGNWTGRWNDSPGPLALARPTPPASPWGLTPLPSQTPTSPSVSLINKRLIKMGDLCLVCACLHFLSVPFYLHCLPCMLPLPACHTLHVTCWDEEDTRTHRTPTTTSPLHIKWNCPCGLGGGGKGPSPFPLACQPGPVGPSYPPSLPCQSPDPFYLPYSSTLLLPHPSPCPCPLALPLIPSLPRALPYLAGHDSLPSLPTPNLTFFATLWDTCLALCHTLPVHTLAHPCPMIPLPSQPCMPALYARTQHCALPAICRPSPLVPLFPRDLPFLFMPMEEGTFAIYCEFCLCYPSCYSVTYLYWDTVQFSVVAHWFSQHTLLYLYTHWDPLTS